MCALYMFTAGFLGMPAGSGSGHSGWTVRTYPGIQRVYAVKRRGIRNEKVSEPAGAVSPICLQRI